jgi:hypothetical protein
MATVRIEGKEITLPDDVVRAGAEAVRAVLAASGFPAVENAHILMPDSPGAPAIVTPRSTGKGAEVEAREVDNNYASFLKTLASASEYVNPAMALAAEAQRAELDGDTEFIERAARSGVLDRAIFEGAREGEGVMKTLAVLGHCKPAASKTVPVGF